MLRPSGWSLHPLYSFPPLPSVFTTSGGVQVLRMDRLFIEGNNSSIRGISIPYLINQMGHFENIYINNGLNEQFYYSGSTGNFVVVRNSIVSGGTKGVVVDQADWVTIDCVFASNQTAIPFHHIGGTRCVMSNCHAYLTQVFVTAAFQTDADFNHGSLDLINPTIENHMYATNGWSLPIAFNATNPGIRSCYNWRNVTAAGTEGITTVFGGSWYSYSGLSQGWSYAENPSGSNTQLDFSYSGQRLWSILPWVPSSRSRASCCRVSGLSASSGWLVGWIEPADAQVCQFRHEPLPPANPIVRVGFHWAGEICSRVQQSIHGSNSR